MPCETRTYTFDDTGNRAGQNTISPDISGTCTTTGGNPITRSYDTADRPTQGANSAGTYTYDPLGRQTSIPAADTTHSDQGNNELSYYDTDAAQSIKQGTLGSGGSETTFTLDGDRRRLKQTTQTDASTSNLVRHYTDESDNPTWSVDTTDGTTTTTRYAELVNGDLGLTLTKTGAETKAQLALVTPRDDTATTVELPTGATTPTGTAAVGIENWTDYNEYGIPNQTTETTAGGTTGIGYGWLGAKQRASLETGLTLMGARLYNQNTGLFTSLDPVTGGNSTSLAYPQDPVNREDLTGTRWAVRRYRFGGGCGCRYQNPFQTYGWYRFRKNASAWGSRSSARVRVIGYGISYFGKRKGSGGSEHTNKKRKSTQGKHQKGRGRKGQDRRGGEKGDRNRPYQR